MEDEKDDVSCYWMALRKQEDTGNWRRTHWISLSCFSIYHEPVV